MNYIFFSHTITSAQYTVPNIGLTLVITFQLCIINPSGIHTRCKTARYATINPTITPSEQPFRRRYNFKKANWETFSSTLDHGITSLATPSWKAYKSFSDLVRVCARKCIPRGCRTKYISGLTLESGELLKHYQELYDADPFSEDTFEAGTNLTDHIKETRKQKW